MLNKYNLSFPIFRYATIQNIRDEGITVTQLSDIRALKLIERYSEMINLFTRRWFIPIVGKAQLDGFSSSIIHFSNYIPILKIDSVKVIEDRCLGQKAYSGWSGHNEAFIITSSKEYSLSQNNMLLELVSSADILGNLYQKVNAESYRVFPEGRKNVEISGVFGFIEGNKDVSTTTTGLITTGTQVNVTNAAIFEIGDAIAFKVVDKYYYTIISNIDYGLNRLFFDTVTFSIPTGSTVYSYGKVPYLISYCIQRLVILNLGTLGTLLGSGGPSIGGIIEEQTDSYRYKLSSEFTTNLSKGSTGDFEVDRIIQEFVAPIDVKVV